VKRWVIRMLGWPSLFLVLLGGLASLLNPARAAEPTERARINQERAALETTRIERERECHTRFAVTACVEDAQQAYRVALAELRRQQALIDEAERRQRASERIDRLANRTAKSIGPPPAPRSPRASEARAAAGSSAASATSASGAEPVPAKLPKPSKPQAVPSGDSAEARAQEAARAAAFEARVKEAQARRAAVERRNAERALKGKASRPLPLPASAATR
jgi:colicin import membrane protein